MKKHLFAGILVSIAIVAIPAHAANYFCVGTITMLGIGTDGTVVVQGPGGIPAVEICSIGAPVNNFSVDSCKATYAMLLSADLSGQQVSVDFSDNLSCSTQPAWTKWAAVYFVSKQ